MGHRPLRGTEKINRPVVEIVFFDQFLMRLDIIHIDQVIVNAVVEPDHGKMIVHDHIPDVFGIILMRDDLRVDTREKPKPLISAGIDMARLLYSGLVLPDIGHRCRLLPGVLRITRNARILDPDPVELKSAPFPPKETRDPQ